MSKEIKITAIELSTDELDTVAGGYLGGFYGNPGGYIPKPPGVVNPLTTNYIGEEPSSPSNIKHEHYKHESYETYEHYSE